MKTHRNTLLTLGLLLALSGTASVTRATDFVWTNTGTSGYYTNDVNIWNQTGVPGINDTVLFTNASVTAYTILFSNASPLYVNSVFFTNTATARMFVTLDIGAGQSWNVLNQYVVGAATATARSNTTVISSGTLAVTNSSGTGLILVGNGSTIGSAKLVLNGGTILVDQLIVTNNIASRTNALFTFTSGTLTTSNAATAAHIVTPGAAALNINGIWNMNGGSNIFQAAGTPSVNSPLITIGATASNAAVYVRNGAVLDAGGIGITVGSGSATGNVLNVTGGTITNSGRINVGLNPLSQFNSMTISNATIWSSLAGLFIAGSNNTVTVLADSTWNFGGRSNAVGSAGSGNRWVINGGIITNMNVGTISSGPGTSSNSLIISNGAKFYSANIYVGGNANTSNNLYQVGGAGDLSTVFNGTITVGNNASSKDNTMNVTNATLLSLAGTIGVAGSSNNTVNVQAGGTWNLQGNNLTVGSTAGTGNVVWVQSGGILQTDGLITGAGAGNRITNSGGVFQFTTNWPTVTIGAGAGSIAISDGTISFLNVISSGDLTNKLDLTDNWQGSGLTNMSFSGNNTLRLNSSTATNTLDGGYTFNTGLGATNYTRLELINSTTAVTGNGVTIGTGGSFLASNTTATLSGAFTNYSPNARIVSSTVDFAGGIYSTGTLTLVNSAVVKGLGAKTIDTNGRLEGNGSVVGDITVNGTVAPGLSAGTLTFSNALTLAGTAEFQLYTDVNGGAGVSDLIVIGADGSIDITGSALSLTLDQSAQSVTNGTQFLLIDNQTGSGITGTFAGYGQGAESTLDGVQFKFDYQAGAGNNDLVLTVIPEPSALTLVGLGLLGAVMLRRFGRGR